MMKDRIEELDVKYRKLKEGAKELQEKTRQAGNDRRELDRDLATYEVNFSGKHELGKKMVNWKKIVDTVCAKINQRGRMVDGEWTYADSDCDDPECESQAEDSEDDRYKNKGLLKQGEVDMILDTYKQLQEIHKRRLLTNYKLKQYHLRSNSSSKRPSIAQTPRDGNDNGSGDALAEAEVAESDTNQTKQLLAMIGNQIQQQVVSKMISKIETKAIERSVEKQREARKEALRRPLIRFSTCTLLVDDIW